MNKRELKILIRELLHEELSRSSLIESTLSAEEKVDAWHNGTRRENYKAAGIPKLTVFLEIAKRKGYDEIVKIIEDELAKRGASAPASTATATTTTSTDKSVTPITPEPESEVASIDPESETAASVDVTDGPAHFSDELVKDLDPETTTLTLSNEEKGILIGKAIEALGKPVFYVKSYWKTAMGFIGSYTHKWFNGNFNEVKADRASDKVVDLTYDSSKLIALRKDIEAGYRNVDRYYSIEIPSSTFYIANRDKIRKNASDYYHYYDSELDWRFYILTKTNANRKKFKQYLIDTVGMPEAQAEELTTEAFDNDVW